MSQPAPSADKTPADKSVAEKPAAPDASLKKPKRQDGAREICESFVVAFVLAFLFRAFEAEAFVIPTGSMAPTLFGRHKEATCEMCRFEFAFGASDEVEDDLGTFDPDRRIRSALCPNCRFENPVQELPAFKGDRIIVNKFPYEFREPERWDVPVFKYPEKPMTNYIKRMVGLPNETIVIKRGDVYRKEADRSLTVLRKEPRKQKGLQVPVYDNNHQESKLHQLGWPRRWSAVDRLAVAAVAAAPVGKLEIGPVAGWTEATNSWDVEDATHSFLLTAERAKAADIQWLRYRHIVPSQDDWSMADNRPRNQAFFFLPEQSGPRPQIVTDFCGYNSYTGGNGNLVSDCYWVGDLTLSGKVEVQSLGETSELVFELNEGVRCYRVRFDLKTGRAKLISVVRLNPAKEDEDVLAEAASSLIGTGTHAIRFANVDDRLCFWVDDVLLDFGAKAEYRVDEATQPGPREDDLIPVGIAARGAAVRVSNLLIERDLYYRSSQLGSRNPEQHHYSGEDEHPDEFALRRVLKNPADWSSTYFARAQDALFELGPDEFLMLGDNSPRSQDSRVWPNNRGAEHRYAVPRSALVGRAFFVYWPHGVPFLNDGQGYAVTHLKARQGTDKYPDLRMPFYPNVPRMRRIH